MEEFLVVGINLGLTIFLIISGSYFFSTNVLKKTEDKELELIRVRSKMVIVVLATLVGLLFTIFFFSAYTEFTIIKDNDVSNWISLAVEIGIGITIAVLILLYSQYREGILLDYITHGFYKPVEEIHVFDNYIPEENRPLLENDISPPEPDEIGKLPKEDEQKTKEEDETVNDDIKKSQEIGLFDGSLMNELLLHVSV